MVHFRSSQYLVPDVGSHAFSPDAHHERSLRTQLRLVWYRRLTGYTEGPTLITGATCPHNFLAAMTSWHDGGEVAAVEVYSGGLGGLMAQLLGDGPWEPEPETWPKDNQELDCRSELARRRMSMMNWPNSNPTGR